MLESGRFTVQCNTKVYIHLLLSCDMVFCPRFSLPVGLSTEYLPFCRSTVNVIFTLLLCRILSTCSE